MILVQLSKGWISQKLTLLLKMTVLLNPTISVANGMVEPCEYTEVLINSYSLGAHPYCSTYPQKAGAWRSVGSNFIKIHQLARYVRHRRIF